MGQLVSHIDLWLFPVALYMIVYSEETTLFQFMYNECGYSFSLFLKIFCIFNQSAYIAGYSSFSYVGIIAIAGFWTGIAVIYRTV